jgi:hypothetical protein
MGMRRATSRPRVERKIYFYRASVGLAASKRLIRFDHAPVLEHVRSLPFSATGRYLEIADGQAVCCWPASGHAPNRLRLGNIRRSGLPQLDRAGRLGALRIPADAGLAEQIHVIFFRNNIVGADFNFYGPRLSRLSEYFARRAEGVCPAVEFEPLLRQDVLEQLRRLGDLRLFSFKVRTSFLDRVAEAERSLGEALRATAEAGSAYEVELVLRTRSRSRETLASRLLTGARRLAALPGLRAEASRFVVRGLDRESGEVEEVDVLRDLFIVSKRIGLESERTRGLDPISAFEAIEEAYGELRADLEAAAGAMG